jgi:hypothetical protein
MGNDEIQLDLFLDYATDGSLYPKSRSISGPSDYNGCGKGSFPIDFAKDL